METFYTPSRREWRRWLGRNHLTAEEIWLVYYRKDSGKPRITYNAAVEEALCYGWIDSVLRKIDDESFAQRFSPRRPRSALSQMNRERIDKLIAQKKMTKAGLEAVAHVYDPAQKAKRFAIPADIRDALEANGNAWRNFQRFPAPYRRIRVAWVDGARSRPDEFAKRLRHLVKMTSQNKRFGFVQEMR
ncbi:MAG: YdeI/OmpD-associated family protein [Actinomycetota bacterium]